MQPFMKIIRYMTLTALVFISACGNNKFADDILEMQSRPIDMSVCEESSCYEAGVETGYNVRDSAYKLVIYIDSLSCSPCFISHMYEYEEIAKEFDSVGIRTVFIFEPQQDKEEDVRSSLRQQAYPFLGIVVRNGGFASANPHLPSSSLLHSFLLDERNGVIVVGNPVRNERIKELMLNSVKR